MTPRMVLARVGEDRVALPLEGVWHILLAPRVIPLVLIRPGFKGVFLYQRKVLPLLDLPSLFSTGRVTDGPDPRYAVVYGTDLGPLGLPVDQVLQIVERKLGTLEVSDPEVLARFATKNSFVYNGNAYPLLDVEALLNTLSR